MEIWLFGLFQMITFQENIQKITDGFIVEVDRLIDAKEKDLLVI